MSLSLLNSYNSSDDSDSANSATETNQEEKKKEIQKRRNFLIGGESDSDLLEEESTDEESNCVSRTGHNKNLNKLPSLPSPFDNIESTETGTSVSVFRNPYLEAERADMTMLEQHVKLTETKLSNEHGRGQKKFRRSSVPCRQFKRGRCRLGDKCGFSHAAPSSTTGETSATSSAASSSVVQGKAVRYTEWGKEEVVDGDEDSDGEKKRKKRRIGVTNSLIPPKKSLQNYEKQRQLESPWLEKHT